VSATTLLPEGGEAGNGRAEPPRRRAAKDLLRLGDLGPGNLRELLALAELFSISPQRRLGVLSGKTVVLYFNKPSTRTRISFETAVALLGGTPVAVGPHELQLDRGESLEDTARVISGYAAAFAIRTYSDEDVRRFAAAATIPVVNALTDGHHPCQVLGDLLTLQHEWGELEGRRLVFLGDGDNVANSLLEGCALAGASITVATPRGLEPDAEVVARARELALSSGSSIELTHDPVAAVREADAVYTDVWVSMGVPEAERPARQAALRPFQVNSALMAGAPDHALFLHCLPAHRGEEVTDEVIDGPRSRVFQQAANRLPTEQAVLYALVGGSLPLPKEV
jgi:ornithine carbamoyltransferase